MELRWKPLLTGWSLVRIRPVEPNRIKHLKQKAQEPDHRKIPIWQRGWQQSAKLASPMERKAIEPIGAPGSRYWLIVAADGAVSKEAASKNREDMHKPPSVPPGGRFQLVSVSDDGEWEDAYNDKEMPPGDGWSATMHPGYSSTLGWGWSSRTCRGPGGWPSDSRPPASISHP
jgi:hypothetical protein